MRLTVRGIILAGFVLLFGGALGYLTRGPIHRAVAESQTAGAAGAATPSTIKAVTTPGAANGTVNPGELTPLPQAGQPKFVNIGLSRHDRHEGVDDGESEHDN